MSGHESYERTSDGEAPSNRAFGFVFVVFFTAVGLASLALTGSLPVWALGLALVTFLVTLFFPAALAPFNRAWMKFGALLHRIVSPVVLGVMFFLVVAPIGIFMRMLGKDLLRLKFERDASSYWAVRSPPGPPAESLKDQF